MSEVQKFGVENLKKVVKFIVDTAKQVVEAGEGGYQLKDLFGFFNEFTQVPGLLKSGDAIKDEISELSSEERQELDLYGVSLGLPAGKATVIVREGLNILFSGAVIVAELKETKATATTEG